MTPLRSRIIDDMALPEAGSPRAITHPGLPLIQTCRFPASGSSSHDFAAPPSRLWTTRAFGSSYRCSKSRNSFHVNVPARRRRDSQRFQIFRAPSRNSSRGSELLSV